MFKTGVRLSKIMVFILLIGREFDWSTTSAGQLQSCNGGSTIVHPALSHRGQSALLGNTD